MRIGCDIDGVLANFTQAYQALTIKCANGVNLFHPNDDKDPPCWNWPEYRGYSKETVSAVWSEIKTSHTFWSELPETKDCSTLRLCILDMQRWHEVYFITSRVGKDVKWQTEQWLVLHLGIERPTVLISSEKGLCARALKLDCYLDDNADNANDVIQATLPKTEKEFMAAAARIVALNPEIVQDPFELGNRVQELPSTRVYLLDKSYNREPGVPEQPVHVDARVRRVDTLGQFIDAELTNL